MVQAIRQAKCHEVTEEDTDINSLEIAVQNTQSTWQTLSQYKAAVLWSAFFGLAGINWGMDVLLSNGVISVPSFQEDFGYIFEDQYIISSGWQIAFNTAASVGGFFGAIGSGYLADRFGKRWTMAIGCVLSVVAVFIQIFSIKSGTLLTGKLINGLSLGVFLTIPSAYASEVCPIEIRGFATSGIQLFISFGQLTANLILKGTGTLNFSLAYKIPFTLQIFFPICLLLGLPFCPESPCRNGKKIITHEEQNAGKASYLDCFRGPNLRRTEIAMGIFSVAQLTGVVFVVGYSSYFFELARLSVSISFSVSVGVSVLGFVGVVCSWFLVNRAGRRSSVLGGLSILTILLFLIGILDLISTSSLGPAYGQVVCIIVFSFMFLFTFGPISYTLFAEISSPRLRSKTVGLGIVVSNAFGVIMNIAVPLMINPDAAALKGKIGFIFGATSVFALARVWLRVPETMGRAWEELDWLFERGVSARRFKGTVVS